MAFVLTNVVGTVNLLNAAKILGKAIMTAKDFTMFQQMKFMVSYITLKISLLKLQLMTHVRHILLQKHLQTIL
jgi:hypothetical protein